MPRVGTAPTPSCQKMYCGSGLISPVGLANGLAVHVPLDTPKVVVEEVVRIPQGRPVIRDGTGLGRRGRDRPDRAAEEMGEWSGGCSEPGVGGSGARTA